MGRAGGLAGVGEAQRCLMHHRSGPPFRQRGIVMKKLSYLAVASCAAALLWSPGTTAHADASGNACTPGVSVSQVSVGDLVWYDVDGDAVQGAPAFHRVGYRHRDPGRGPRQAVRGLRAGRQHPFAQAWRHRARHHHRQGPDRGDGWLDRLREQRKHRQPLLGRAAVRTPRRSITLASPRQARTAAATCPGLGASGR